MGKKRVLKVLGNKLIISRTPPWAYKKGDLTFKGYPVTAVNPTPAQKEARKTLAMAAYNAFGTTGKTYYKGVLMPKICAEVAERVAHGEGAYGGKSKEERRRERHEATRIRWGF